MHSECLPYVSPVLLVCCKDVAMVYLVVARMLVQFYWNMARMLPGFSNQAGEGFLGGCKDIAKFF